MDSSILTSLACSIVRFLTGPQFAQSIYKIGLERGLPGTFYASLFHKQVSKRGEERGTSRHGKRDFPARNRGLPGTKKGTSRHVFLSPNIGIKMFKKIKRLIRIQSL